MCTLVALLTLPQSRSSVHMPAMLAERVDHLQLACWVVLQQYQWNDPNRPRGNYRAPE